MNAEEEYARFREKFSINALSLVRIDGWQVSLRPTQATLGALVVSMSRPCLSFSELDHAETRALTDVFRLVECVLRKFSDCEKINYLALMMVDAHLHFHVIPRYEGSRAFGGMAFPDHGWPALPDLGRRETAVPVLEALTQALKQMFVSKGNVE